MRLLYPLLTLTGAAAVGLVLAAPAAAHDELVGSSPANGATISRLPAAVMLYFEEAPESSPVSMVVRGPDGAKINSGGPDVNGATITEELRAGKAAGAYSIDYRIMSDDGHPVSGTVRFTVGSAEGAAAEPGAAGAAAGGSTRTATWLVVGAGALAAGLLGLGGAIARRRRRPTIAAASRPEPEPEPEPAAR